MPSPRVHVGQGFLHGHAVFDGIDVAIFFFSYYHYISYNTFTTKFKVTKKNYN